MAGIVEQEYALKVAQRFTVSNQPDEFAHSFA
jgi:hypothetical protein